MKWKGSLGWFECLLNQWRTWQPKGNEYQMTTLFMKEKESIFVDFIALSILFVDFWQQCVNIYLFYFVKCKSFGWSRCFVLSVFVDMCYHTKLIIRIRGSFCQNIFVWRVWSEVRLEWWTRQVEGNDFFVSRFFFVYLFALFGHNYFQHQNSYEP